MNIDILPKDHLDHCFCYGQDGINNLEEFMNIEIAPNEYWKRLNWNDGLLYLSLLIIDGKNNWRYPKSVELSQPQPDTWYIIDGEVLADFPEFLERKHYVIPVRDI